MAVGGATLDGRAAREGVDCRRCVGKWGHERMESGTGLLSLPSEGGEIENRIASRVKC